MQKTDIQPGMFLTSDGGPAMDRLAVERQTLQKGTFMIGAPFSGKFIEKEVPHPFKGPSLDEINRRIEEVRRKIAALRQAVR
jgi:hypothetical protein